MNASELKEGIRILWDMEKNNYYMTNAISRLNMKINSLGIKRTIEKPKKDLLESKLEIWIIGFLKGLGSAACGAVIGAIVVLILELFHVLDPNKMDYVKYTIIECLIIGLPALSLFCFILWAEVTDRKDANRKKREKNKENADKYNKSLTNENIRIKRELYEREILIVERDRLKEKLANSKKLTSNIYSKMDIDYEYRNIVPIGYMEEFLRLGIATQLEGKDGLYYLVRQELRSDQMKYTLDQITQKLDQIIDNQHSIYSSLSSLNRKCYNLVTSSEKNALEASRQNLLLESVVNSSSITAYNTERTRIETEYRNFMTLIGKR